MPNKKFTESEINYQIENEDLEDSLREDSDDILLDTDCPNCGKEYDSIDYEFQICHFCGFINS